MRYYELTITPQKTNSPAVEKSLMCTGVNPPKQISNTKKPIVFSTLKNDGSHNPNALQIEFDLPVAGFHDPAGSNNTYIRLSGIPLDLMSQARDLNGAAVELQAGMSKGLPLVNPEQRGLILSGGVLQAFGNWQGENMTLDIVVIGIQSITGDYSFQWKKGDKMVDMITQTIKRNHPDYTVKSRIKENLVLSNDETGAYSNISQFSTYVFNQSKSIITDLNYQGVTIIVQGKTIIVQDGSSPKNPKPIKYADMIGQPTWIDFSKIQVKVNMRADIFVGDFITLPLGTVRLATQGAFNTKKDKTTFNGNYMVYEIRHLGNSRQPDANSWVTIINCVEQ